MTVSDNLALLGYTIVLYFPLIIFCILLAHLTKNILLFSSNLVIGYKTGMIDDGTVKHKRRRRHIAIIAYILAGFVLIGLQGPYAKIFEALRNID